MVTAASTVLPSLFAMPPARAVVASQTQWVSQACSNPCAEPGVYQVYDFGGVVSCQTIKVSRACAVPGPACTIWVFDLMVSCFALLCLCCVVLLLHLLGPVVICPTAGRAR